MPPPHLSSLRLPLASRPLCDALPAALIIPALRPPAQRPACGSASPTPSCSICSKHGFHFYRQASPGNSSAHNQRPCLSNPLPHRVLQQHTC